MKSILLTSTALVAFAGAAAADGHATGFSFSGAAELGYNDSSDVNDAATAEANDGFFWDLEIDATATTTLDNGPDLCHRLQLRSRKLQTRSDRCRVSLSLLRQSQGPRRNRRWLQRSLRR